MLCYDVGQDGAEGRHYPMKLLPRVQQEGDKEKRVSEEAWPSPRAQRR